MELFYNFSLSDRVLARITGFKVSGGGGGGGGGLRRKIFKTRV